MNRRILIVGGVAAGASAAARARRVDENAEIVVFERGDYASFANCGLPYYISREIANRGSLIVVRPELFRRRHNIDVRLRHEVVTIDTAARTISVRDIDAETIRTEPYDALVLAPGARPIVPDMPLIGAPNLFTMRTIPDTDRIGAWISEKTPRRATIVGAGYVGLEMAEALLARGLAVTVVEKAPQVLPPLDADMATPVEDALRAAGIDVVTGDGLAAFRGDRAIEMVVTEQGREIAADLVLLSIGVRPDTALAKAAGLRIGPTGAIWTSATMQTSDPHIWAAGDAVENVHLVTGKPAWVPLAGPANKQGRVAGTNAAGGSARFAGMQGTAIVRFGTITAAGTGLNERNARREGYDVAATTIHASQHASYYPGAEMLAVKITFERHSGRLLGAQVVGSDGVDKRIDVLATAIAGHMTVDDLADLDLAYAPPFGSARDPVNVAGFAAQNAVSGFDAQITADELHTLLAEQPLDEQPVQLIDVRTPAEHAEAHIAGSVLIPVDELRDRIGEIDPARPAIVYCRIGLRGHLASRTLRGHGIDARNLAGGILSWRFAKESGIGAGRTGLKVAKG